MKVYFEGFSKKTFRLMEIQPRIHLAGSEDSHLIHCLIFVHLRWEVVRRVVREVVVNNDSLGRRHILEYALFKKSRGRVIACWTPRGIFDWVVSRYEVNSRSWPSQASPFPLNVEHQR